MMSLFRNFKSISFQDATSAAEWLLLHVGESHWAKHFSRKHSGRDSFRSAFGGMGSLSDLVICLANNHTLQSHQEPIANELLRCLCSISYELSNGGRLDANDAVDACGTMGNQLSGCRCRTCGHSLISERSLLGLAAYYDARMAIQAGVERQDLRSAVKDAFDRVTPHDGSTRFLAHAKAAGINYSENDGWMRPCLICGSEDTCVYRWNYDGHDFTEATDNLIINKR